MLKVGKTYFLTYQKTCSNRNVPLLAKVVGNFLRMCSYLNEHHYVKVSNENNCGV